MKTDYPIIDGGQFIAGGPNNLGTIVTAEFMNGTQDCTKSTALELETLIKAAGITPNATQYDQVLKSIRKLLDTDKTDLLAKLKLAMPVGLLAHTISGSVPNPSWLMCNGEWLHKDAKPMLYSHLVACGMLVINDGDYVQIPDARGLVFRSQNKGRFNDVDEIGLGKYQADATQHIFGQAGASIRIAGYPSTGAFYDAFTSVYGPSDGSGNGLYYANFDNSRVARTALEDRVKSLGTNAMIFAGFD